jgi:rRNA maturation RNase YbeY
VKVEKAFAAAVALRAGRPAGARGELGVEVVWVADREMRALKRRFSGSGGTTDVLAFEDADGQTVPGTFCAKHSEGRSGKRFLAPFPRRLGEIVCNLELAGREAARHGHTREAEAVLYATHGLVHLLGGRDGTPRGRREMRIVELGALRAAGLRVRGGEWDSDRRKAAAD